MPGTPLALSAEELRALRWRAQRLVPDRGERDAAAAAAAVWPQAQMAQAAALAVRARSRGLVASDVERARVAQRTLVRTWAMRGTLHLVPTADLPWVLAAVTPSFVPAARRWFARKGFDVDPDAALAGLARALHEVDAPLSRRQVARRLGLGEEDRSAVGVLHLAALLGRVVQGPDRDGETAYVAAERWLGPLRLPAPEQARATMARRYLAGYGPAAAEDLAAWAGIGLRAARAAFDAIRGECVAVRAAGRELWMLTDGGDRDRDDGSAPCVRLLPSFDPWLLGWRGRGHAVRARHASAVLPGGGILKPVLAVDGRVLGLWSTRRRASRLELALAPFGRLPRAVREGVEAEAADLGRFLGTRVQVVPD